MVKQVDNQTEQASTVALLEAVKQFKNASEEGKYYQPEDKNKSGKPKEPSKTMEWQEKFSNLLSLTHQLSQEGWHKTAVDCYHLLFECIEMLYDEEQKGILAIHRRNGFLDELTEQQREEIEQYIISLAKAATPSEYADCLILFIVADYPACEDQVYEIALREANAAQRQSLDEEIEKREVKITMEGEYYGD